MQKLTKENMLTALMIRLDQLETKIDKLLENQFTVIKTNTQSRGCLIRWPNESYEEYLKRAGIYNTAQSDDEYFGEVYK